MSSIVAVRAPPPRAAPRRPLCPLLYATTPGLRRLANGGHGGDNRSLREDARMAQPFDANNAPFNRLSLEELGIVRDALDIGYFCPGETIIARDSAPDSLFIIIKGSVEERDGDEVVALRGPGDAFDSRALAQGGGANAFVAREETLCNLLPRDVTLRLIKQNPRFASFFYLDISRKLDAISREEEAARFAPLLGARVGDLHLHRATFIDATDSIQVAGARMWELKAYALFVRDGGRTG